MTDTAALPYADGAAFLAAERRAWQPYEALLALSDDALDVPREGAHGWTGRDLIAHLVGWHDVTISVVRGLAAADTTVLDSYYGLNDAQVDAMNADTIAAWRELPIAEVRRRLVEIPAALRNVLAAAPDRTWLRDERGYQWMLWNTMEHYEGHAPDLAAIVDGAA